MSKKQGWLGIKNGPVMVNVATVIKDEYCVGGRRLYGDDGMRLTSCCGAHSTFSGGYLCCKNCYEIVPIGEGDGNEFLNEEGE